MLEILSTLVAFSIFLIALSLAVSSGSRTYSRTTSIRNGELWQRNNSREHARYKER
jgi:hypothetical protein